eukprot:1137798-Pelagomonas_calceolata.AAC.6
MSEGQCLVAALPCHQDARHGAGGAVQGISSCLVHSSRGMKSAGQDEIGGRLGLHLFSLTFRRQRGRMLTFGLRCYVSAGMYTSQVWGTGSVQALVSPLLASLSGNLSSVRELRATDDECWAAQLLQGFSAELLAARHVKRAESLDPRKKDRELASDQAWSSRNEA